MAREYSSSQPTLPVHLCSFMLILLMFMGFSWYLKYEPVMESLSDQLKVYLMVSPLLLVLIVQWLSDSVSKRLIPLPDQDSVHRAGGTAWGVGFLLVLLFFMISHHSHFRGRCFPLLSR